MNVMQPFTEFTGVMISYMKQGENGWTRGTGWFWVATFVDWVKNDNVAHGPFPNYPEARDNFEKEYVR